MTKKNMLLTMLMVVINNWLLNMVLTMGLMITVKNKNDKVQALAESSAIMLLVVIYFLHRWEFHLSHMIIHNVLLFSHLFEKKYAYELLDKLNLYDQDYGKIRHVMSEFYKKEGM